MARGRPEKVGTKPVNGNGAHLGFEAQLFLAADKLRKNLEPSDYKHVALGLIFLRHISNAFEAKQEALLAEDRPPPKTRANTLPKTSSGCRRRPAGPTCRPTLGSPPLVK